MICLHVWIKSEGLNGLVEIYTWNAILNLWWSCLIFKDEIR